LFEPEPVDQLLEFQSSLGLTQQELEFLKAELNGFAITKGLVSSLAREATYNQESQGGLSRPHVNSLRDQYFDGDGSLGTKQLDSEHRHIPSYHMHGVIDSVIAERFEGTLEVLIAAYQEVTNPESLKQLHINDLTGLAQRAIKVITLLSFSGTLADESNRGKLPGGKSIMWAIEAGSRVALWSISNTILTAHHLGVNTRESAFLNSLEMVFRRMMNANIALVAPHQQYLALSPDRYYIENNFLIQKGTGLIEIRPGSPLDLALLLSKNSIQDLAQEFKLWIREQKAEQMKKGAGKYAHSTENGIDQIHENYWASLLGLVGLAGGRTEKIESQERLARAKMLYTKIIERYYDRNGRDIEAYYDRQLVYYSITGSLNINLVHVDNNGITSGCSFRFTTMKYFDFLAKRLPGVDISSMV
jgi:hypothetical protein